MISAKPRQHMHMLWSNAIKDSERPCVAALYVFTLCDQVAVTNLAERGEHAIAKALSATNSNSTRTANHTWELCMYATARSKSRITKAALGVAATHTRSRVTKAQARIPLQQLARKTCPSCCFSLRLATRSTYCVK